IRQSEHAFTCVLGAVAWPLQVLQPLLRERRSESLEGSLRAFLRLRDSRREPEWERACHETRAFRREFRSLTMTPMRDCRAGPGAARARDRQAVGDYSLA